MPDYKRAFNLLVDKLGIYWGNVFEFNGLAVSCDGLHVSISEEEHDLFADCYSYGASKPDSMDKIIEEFKKLGYIKKETEDTLEFIKYSHIEWEEQPVIDGSISIFKKINDIVTLGYITRNELSLINRIYKLWGVEV